MSEIFDSQTTFADLGLSSNICRGVKDCGFEFPTHIQSKLTPEAVKGHDILGQSKTGTGKTAAFAIPILDVMLNDPCRGPSALVVAPTRELASQIERDIKTLARSRNISSVITKSAKQILERKLGGR